MKPIRLLLLGWISWVGCEPATAPSDTRSKSPRVVRNRVERGPVTVTVEVAPAPARLSDEPQLTMTIEYEPGIEIQKPPFGDAVGDFIVRGFREPLPQSDGKRFVMQQIYTLEPTQAGPSQIDPIVVSFTDKRTAGDGKQHRVETEALTVEVTSTVGERSPILANLKGPQGPVPLPTPPSNLLWLLLGGVIAAAVTVGVWVHYRRAAPEPTRTPRELAEQELEALWKSDAARHEVKSFYVELTGIVRRFIERTTGIHAPEQTTEEFLREVMSKSAFAGQERQRLQEFLEAADLVKFAAHKPLYQDIEAAFQRAQLFVGHEPSEHAPSEQPA